MRVRALLLAAALALSLTLGDAPASASPYADFTAAIEYSDSGREARPCGTAAAAGAKARMDIDLGRVGVFTLLIDTESRQLYVLSQKLKAYVLVPVEGDPRNWRDLVASASAVIMPQSLGLVGIRETEREDLGRESVQGYPAQKSRSVFEISFMGTVRQIGVEVWENSVFAPFPLKVRVPESRNSREGSAWLADIEAARMPDAELAVPEEFTRYTSVMDLLLFALTAF
ncbi:hypothetical protein [Mailhella sp.]|uniref:hypothetical protein n=1 Tax=Mailhella sp. TaxID=1981029 RepID=UPI0040644A75